MLNAFLDRFTKPTMNFVMVSEATTTIPFCESRIRMKKGNFEISGDIDQRLERYCHEHSVVLIKNSSTAWKSRDSMVYSISGSAVYSIEPTDYPKQLTLYFRLIYNAKTLDIFNTSYYGFSVQNLATFVKYNPNQAEYTYERIVSSLRRI